MPPLRESSTGGLPELVRTLHAERSRAKGADPNDPNEPAPSSGVALIALLHCVVVVLLLVGTITSNETSDFRDAATFLPNGGGTLPTPFRTLSVVNIVLYSIFVLVSVLDAAWFLATQVHVTGIGLGLGLASSMLTGGLVVLASIQLKESVFWVYLVALLGSTVVIALQLATILSLLVNEPGPLLRAIRMAV
jgi:hypothetical protein